MSTIEDAIQGREPLAAANRIAEKAAGDRVAISADDCLDALPGLEGVAIKFTMEDSLQSSYLWHDGDAYRAAELGPGLEDREHRPLDRHEAGGLLDGGLGYEPVPAETAPSRSDSSGGDE